MVRPAASTSQCTGREAAGAVSVEARVRCMRRRCVTAPLAALDWKVSTCAGQVACLAGCPGLSCTAARQIHLLRRAHHLQGPQNLASPDGVSSQRGTSAASCAAPQEVRQPRMALWAGAGDARVPQTRCWAFEIEPPLLSKNLLLLAGHTQPSANRCACPSTGRPAEPTPVGGRSFPP